MRESERNRIARDIHDDLGQHLLALKIELSLMQVSTNGAHPPMHQKIGGLLHSLDLTHRVAAHHHQRPAPACAGTRLAGGDAKRHLAEFSRLNGIRHQLEADPDAFRREPDRSVDAMLFRILQESLANVARHAQATEVKIALSRSGDQLTLKVRDNGIGMAGQPASRAAAAWPALPTASPRPAASSSSTASPGAGTLLSLSIPLSRPVATH